MFAPRTRSTASAPCGAGAGPTFSLHRLSLHRIAVVVALLAALGVPALGAAQTTALASAAPSSTAATPTAAELHASLDALFAAAYPADEPGAAVLVKRGDEILLRSGYGMANLELGVPVAPDMVFRIGSVTKQFTAVGILLLQAEGKLSLDDRLGDRLPGYPEPGASVTLRQLLTHTSGVPSYTGLPDFWKTSRDDLSGDEMLAMWKDLPLDFAPGSSWHYSNSGYFLLGLVIEKTSGQSYQDFLRRRILDPVGLSHTYYGDPAKITPRRVQGYDGEPGAYVNAAYLSMTQPFSAGALLSTVDDLATWNDKVLFGDALLSAEARRRLETPGSLDDGRRLGYAFGLVEQSYLGHRLIGHGGGINGFASQSLAAPEDGVFVAVLSNNTGRPPGPASLATQAMAMVLGTPLEERPRLQLGAEELAEFQGVYAIEGEDGKDRMIRLDGDHLTAQRSGGSRTPIHFSAPDHFYFEGSLLTGRFERDAEGRVARLWIEPQAGPEERSAKTDRPLPTREAITLPDTSILDAYVGRYELAPGFVLEITRQGDDLFAQATGQPRFQVFPESETRWFLEVVDAVIDFVGGEDGEADSLVLHQGGRDMPAPRQPAP